MSETQAADQAAPAAPAAMPGERGPLAEVIVLGDADVRAAVTMADAVAVLEEAFTNEAEGLAETMQRTRVVWDGGYRMQSLGGYFTRRGCAGVKSWLVTARGAQPTVILFSLEDGRVLAIMEAV